VNGITIGSGQNRKESEDMFTPGLGVSLHMVSGELSQTTLEAIDGSRIATMEIAARVFGDNKLRSERASLQETMRRGEIRPMTVHARSYDISSLDERTYRNAITETLSSVDLAVEFDAPMIVVHASGEPIAPEERPERLEQTRRALAEIGVRCLKEGKRVAIELLPRTCLANTVEEILELVDALGDKTFGVCLDTNHLMDRYRSLADDVRRLGNRLITLHLSDYDGVDEKHDLPGKGVIDWESFMESLRDINYSGPFNYECTLEGETPQERIETLQENFRWLTGMA